MEMVERVARALHQAHMPWCDYTYPFEDPMSGRAVYEALARAAIAAMREPTQAMLDATGEPGVPDYVYAGQWREMIDAALPAQSMAEIS